MAVYSMTGFAQASDRPGSGPGSGAEEAPSRPANSSASANFSVTVEARSVNSRFLDLALRLPDEMRGLEPALRELVARHFGAARSSCGWPPSAMLTTPGRIPNPSS